MEDLERQMDECKKYVKHPFTLETIYVTLLNFNDIEPRFEGIPVWHMAYTIYLIYCKNPSPIAHQDLLFALFPCVKSHKNKEISDAGTSIADPATYMLEQIAEFGRKHNGNAELIVDTDESSRPKNIQNSNKRKDKAQFAIARGRMR